MFTPRAARFVGFIALLAVLIAGCDGGDGDSSPPTSTAPATETTTAIPSEPSPTPTTTPEPTATATPPSPTGMLLVDVQTGTATGLYAGDSFPYTRGFEGDGSLWVSISSENRSLHFDAGGGLIEEVEGYHAGDEQLCLRLPGDTPRAEIDGQEYPVTCGVFSPDGRRMLYFVDVENAQHPQGEYEAWVLDLDSDDMRLVVEGLRHCGGCDGRAGPAWSPYGWYVILGETYSGEDSAVYVVDVELGDATVLARGPNVNEMGRQPQWSPVEDLLIAPAEDGWTQLLNPADGAVTPLEVPWPARFDDTGSFVYSYAVAGDPFAFDSQTTIASIEDGAIVATWHGRPPFVWPDSFGVTSISGEPAALLEGCNDLKDECDPAEPCPGGTAVHHPDLDEPRCLGDSLGAEWSPDRMQVAAARRIEGAPMEPPYAEAWEVVLYDLESNEERVLVSEVRPPGGEPPRLYWSPDGSHILVQWPRPSGI